MVVTYFLAVLINYTISLLNLKMDIRKFITKTSRSDSSSNTTSCSTSTISLSTNTTSEQIIENREFPNIISGDSIQATEKNMTTQNTFNTVVDIGDKNSGPVQPIINSYPKTLFGNQKRSFSPNWFDEYNFLEYSVQNDRVYCYACRHFSTCTVYVDLTLINIGLCDWKNGKNW